MTQGLSRLRKIALLAFFLFVLVSVGVVLYGMTLWTRIGEPYKGYEAREQFLDVAPGLTTAEIRRRLVASGIVRDDQTLRVALWWTGKARSLQAGEYRFDRPMSAVDVIDRIARGDVYTVQITFPEGLTIPEMARIYESGGFGTAGSFIDAAADASAIQPLDPEAGDLEGYLFPDTYSLPRRVAASQLVRVMVDRFHATFDERLRMAAADQELTVREVVALAALVEKETARAEERPVVAAVYRNRLRIGMRMQADPTVVYALMQAGRYDGNITRDDLGIDSPYNTYRYAGLPPGPIASPGRASIEAALFPADVPYLYFVSRNDGTHVFAETLREHNANVYEYQVLFFRRQREEQRKTGNGVPTASVPRVER